MVATLDNLKKEIKSYGKKIEELRRELDVKIKEIKAREKELEKIRESITHSDRRAMDITRNLAEIKKRYETRRKELHELELSKDRLYIGTGGEQKHLRIRAEGHKMAD